MDEHPLVDKLYALLRQQETLGEQVARMLHDDAGQVLTAIGLHLDVLRMDLPEDRRPPVAEVQALLEHAIGRIREASNALHPGVVERAGLGYALEKLVSRARLGGSATVTFSQEPGTRWPSTTARAAYRMVEALLENAVAHAQAHRIEVRLQSSWIEVRDDGQGFDPSAVTAGWGFTLIGYLSREAGIEFCITTRPEQGTIGKLYRTD